MKIKKKKKYGRKDKYESRINKINKRISRKTS